MSKLKYCTNPGHTTMGKNAYDLQEEAKVPGVTSCRWIVAYMIFLGTIALYLNRINMSVGIVCMTYDPIENDTSINSSGLHYSSYSLDDCPDLDDSDDSIDGEFDWDRQLRGWILSSFFYGYTLTQFPAGWLAFRYGAKKIIFTSIAFTTLGTFLSPIAAYGSPYLLIAVRVFMGLASGLFYPAVAHLLSSWAPPAERSALAGFAYSGSSLGSILSFAVSGLLCEYGFAGGWPSVFYVYGIVSVLWLAAFLFLVYDNPAQHPRISPQEKDFIEQAKEEVSNTDEKIPVPWRQFWTSIRLWAMVIADIAYGWALYTMLTSLPQYLKDVLRFDIATSGLYNSLPYICQFLMSISSSFLVDWIRMKGVSTTVVRKTVETIALFPGALFLIGAAYLDCTQPAVAIAFLCISVGLTGGHRSGVLANQLDIAPRFAGLVMGVANTLGNVTGIIAPTVNAALVPTGALDEWRTVFYLTAGIQIVGTLVFVIFASGEVQDWAKAPEDELSVDVDESQPKSIDKDKHLTFDNKAFTQPEEHSEIKDSYIE